MLLSQLLGNQDWDPLFLFPAFSFVMAIQFSRMIRPSAILGCSHAPNIFHIGGNLKEGKAINLVILIGFLVDFYFCFLFLGGGGGGVQGREVSLSSLENYLPWFKFPCNHCFYFKHNCWVICNERRQIYSWLLKCIPLLMQGALNSFKILFFNLKLCFWIWVFIYFFFFLWVNLGFLMLRVSWNVIGYIRMCVILETLFN